MSVGWGESISSEQDCVFSYTGRRIRRMAAATMTNAASVPAAAPSGNAIETAHEDMIVSELDQAAGPRADSRLDTARCTTRLLRKTVGDLFV